MKKLSLHKLKKILPIIILLFMGINVFGTAKVETQKFRWRNDNGSEIAATWKAEVNVPIYDVGTDNIRVRFVLESTGDLGDYNYSFTFKYSTDPTSGFNPVNDNPGTDPFQMALTNEYDNEDPTTDVIGITGEDFIAGYCIEEEGEYSTILDTDEYTEYEYCLKATSNAIPGQTYYFRPDCTELSDASYVASLTIATSSGVPDAHDNPTPDGTGTATATGTNTGIIMDFTNVTDPQPMNFDRWDETPPAPPSADEFLSNSSATNPDGETIYPNHVLDKYWGVSPGTTLFAGSYNIKIPVDGWLTEEEMLLSVVLYRENEHSSWMPINTNILSNSYGKWLSATTSTFNKAYQFAIGREAPIIWNGSVSSDWTDTDNWDNPPTQGGPAIPPDESYNVVITNEGFAPVITSSVSCNSLTINGGVSFTVNSGGSVKAYNILTINNGASLTVNSGASLITMSTITNNGTVDVKREISNGQWHLISSPNSVATANVFDGDFLQTWSESTATWEDVTDPTASLTKVKGYSLWGIAKSTTYTFIGTPNTGDQSIAITAGGSGDFTGANLLGNPYPSSIDWGTVSTDYGAVYYWNGTAYVSYLSGSGAGSQYIPPMQGFFIIKGVFDAFNLDNGNRVHTGATNFYKSSNNIVNGIVLSASNGWYDDELYIRFNDQSQPEFELQYDACKFLSNTEGLSQLYSFADDKMFSIDVRPETNIIQLGFQNDKAGDYSIGIKDMSDVTQAILEDTKTGVMHNLQNDSYNFLWELSDDEKRFKLHLETNDIENVSEDFFSLYANNNMLYVKTDKTIKNGSIKVIDLLGRVMIEQEIKSSNNLQLATNLDTGIYIVVVEDGEKIGSEKVLIK